MHSIFLLVGKINFSSEMYVFLFIKSELLSRYGGVAPKMAEEAHSQAIDQVRQSTIPDLEAYCSSFPLILDVVAHAGDNAYLYVFRLFNRQ